jgi:2-iminobutanoate/2-iminopropanoate deaminase
VTERRTYNAEAAPAAVGPYSHAASANGFVFASGQLGIDPLTGKLVEGGVEAQARQALANLRAVAEAAGTSLELAVKVNVYLVDMADFQVVNAVYCEFFPGEQPPARAAAAVAALPLGGQVEVDAVLAIR